MIVRGNIKEIVLFYENQLKKKVNSVVVDNQVFAKDDIYIKRFISYYGGVFKTEYSNFVLTITTQEDYVIKHSVEVSLCE